MFTKIFIIKCLTDNYAYIIHNEDKDHNILVDAPEEEKIINFLEKKEWKLNSILLTHHHHDHIAGVEELRKKYNCKVYGSKKDQKRLPRLDFQLGEEEFEINNIKIKSLEVDGHTIGHLAFYFEKENILFSGDSLMSFGCGRLFEGTAYQMFESLEKLKKLPPKTFVYSGHEYSLNNANFAVTLEKSNEKIKLRKEKIISQIKKNLPTIPVTLEEEVDTNPFLRSHIQEIKNKLKMKSHENRDIFKKIRELKDQF